MIQVPTKKRIRFQSMRHRVNDPGREILRRFGIADPVRVSIALLSDDEILKMPADDLVCVIDLADIPPIDKHTFQSLEFRRIGDLRRLVFAIRTACRDYCYRIDGSESRSSGIHSRIAHLHARTEACG